jgi:hypothetical protein
MYEAGNADAARPLADDMPAGSGFVAKPYQPEKVAADLRAMVG